MSPFFLGGSRNVSVYTSALSSCTYVHTDSISYQALCVYTICKMTGLSLPIQQVCTSSFWLLPIGIWIFLFWVKVISKHIQNLREVTGEKAQRLPLVLPQDLPEPLWYSGLGHSCHYTHARISCLCPFPHYILFPSPEQFLELNHLSSGFQHRLQLTLCREGECIQAWILFHICDDILDSQFVLYLE